jgi:rare lipoprotein A
LLNKSFYFMCLAAFLALSAPVYANTCVASHYGVGDGYGGRRTASGERMNPRAMTAAHRTLPFGARLRVCHSGCVVVRITDRGPWVRGRCLDLSYGAARAIGLGGTGRVTFERADD